MNDHLRERINRKLDALTDERGYQVLDYVEFLESKYAERQAPQGNAFTRFTEAVEDRLRAGKVSAAAIAEMVMQSRLNTVTTAEKPSITPEIELLPALPAAWPAGSMKGLRARGGFEVDVGWRDGKLTEAVVRSANGGSATLRLGDTTRAVKLSKGGSFRWDGK